MWSQTTTSMTCSDFQIHFPLRPFGGEKSYNSISLLNLAKLIEHYSDLPNKRACSLNISKDHFFVFKKLFFRKFGPYIFACLFIKGGFFSESEIRFSNLPISQKNYSKNLSWAWNLNKLFTVMGGNFKFQVQDSDLE